MPLSRRQFAGITAWTAASYQRIQGANGRVGLAVIGSGRRGRDVAKAALSTGQAEMRVICDVYDVQRERARTALAETTAKPAECTGHEEALANKDVDAVVIATPDHLHLDLATEAFRAGKHVYLEKPAVHQYNEGRQLLRAARLSGKICQIGTQQRSGSHYKQAREQYFGKGRLGRVVLVRAQWNNFPWQARKIQTGPRPAGLDWLRFLGRTPYYDYDAARYDAWRYFPEYGGGVLADIFNHWADVAQWMMGDAMPVRAVALGGIYELKDGRANPDTANAIVQYREWNLSFECSVLSLRDDRPGILFQGDEASLFLARDGFVFTPGKGEPVEARATEDLDKAHAADFLTAIRDNKPPSADIATGLQGALPCHMARAAYWSGQPARYDAARDRIVTG